MLVRSGTINQVYVLFFTVIAFYCCTSSEHAEVNDNLPSYPVHKRVSEWNDTVFLSFVKGLFAYENTYLIPDLDHKFLLQLDSNLTIIRSIGKEGKGPNEFLFPMQTLVFKDTIFTFDPTNKAITYHNLSGEYLGETKTPASIGLTGRMAVDDAFNFYLGSPKSPSSIIKFDLQGNELDHFGASRENYLSLRHLFWTEQNMLLSIGCVEPNIELYNPSGELVKSYTFEKIPEVLAAMKHIKKIYAASNYSWQNMLYEIIYDASYANGKLYALYRHHPPNADAQGVMIGNQLLVFDIFPEISLAQKIDLEPRESGRFYNSICVNKSGNRLLAFENTEKEVCVFNIRQ